MTRVVRNAAIFCAVCSLVASAAVAQPDPAHSSVGNGTLAVAGSSSSGPSTIGNLTVTIHDFNDLPVNGSIVVIDFFNCLDINISCDQLFSTTGQTWVQPHRVQGTANSLGQFTFKVQGAGTIYTATCGTANCAGSTGSCAVVLADGIPIGNLRVAALDIDRAGSPSNAVSVGTDVAKVKQEQLNVGLGAVSYARDDYDFNGVVSVNDVSLEVQFALGGSSKDTMHAGWETWFSAGTFAGLCP